jgi:DNA primase
VRFDERLLDEIKARLRPSEVIGKSVKLKRQGREWAGLSPFSKEKTPSFFVNDDKGFYHDFSSGKHGDIFSFLQETQRLTFPEAVERLAAEAGVALPKADAREAEAEVKRRGLEDWLELSAKWFEANLRRPAGAAARAYLAKRGLPESDWSKFRLGFAPAERTALRDTLAQRGAKPSELVEAGLLIAPEGGGSPYDRFRNRIIFPITDARGRMISFGGRALDPEDRAKYLNGPESPLFHKGSHLYGLHEAKRLMAGTGDGGGLYVVEGYMDVIACQRAGIAAVAPMGTALTEDQIRLLWRQTAEPVLCFDGDSAGLRAAYRALDRVLPLLEPGRTFRFALLSGGQDPDDLLRDKGALALKDALSHTRPLIEVLFLRERDAEPLDTPERKAGFKRRLRKAAASVRDRDLAEQFTADLLARFEALFPREAFKPAAKGAAWRRGMPPPAGPASAELRKAGGRPPPLGLAAAALAQGAIDDPERLDACLEALEQHGFGDPALDPLVKEVIRLRLASDALDTMALQQHLTRSGFGALLREITKAALKSGAPFLAPETTLADARARWSQAFDLLTRLAALESAVASGKAQDLLESDSEAFRRLKAERDVLKRAIKAGTIWTDEAS